jgi:hypothetical protein
MADPVPPVPLCDLWHSQLRRNQSAAPAYEERPRGISRGHRANKNGFDGDVGKTISPQLDLEFWGIGEELKLEYAIRGCWPCVARCQLNFWKQLFSNTQLITFFREIFHHHHHHHLLLRNLHHLQNLNINKNNNNNNNTIEILIRIRN